jgi:hypothetical protein
MQRLCGGGLRHYLGNGSEADIACQTELNRCRQICPALRPVKTGSAQRGDAWGDRAEVSRGHSTRSENRGAGIRPFKLGDPQARSGKGRTNIGEPTCAPIRLPTRQRITSAKPHRRARRRRDKPEPPQGAMSVGNRTQAETASSRGYTLIDVLQPENLARAWTATRRARKRCEATPQSP